jgi:hypothetical protein
MLLAAVICLALNACKKSYTIGGSTFKAEVNMTTYDYLKTNHLFDTLVIMIDRTGLKDELNQSGTFFASTNYSINSFTAQRADSVRLWRNDENYPYNFDSLDLPSLRDSLRSYMFHDRITRDNISKTGLYRKANDGEMRLIQLIATADYTNSTVFTTNPQYIYFTKIIPWQGNPVPVDSSTLGNVKPEQLLSTLCQTTGILTTTGVLHVLNNNHMFDYYNDNN